MSGATYLITGANRGIGLGLTESLLKRPDTTVVATVRNPSSSTSAFSRIQPASGSKLVVVKIDSSAPADAQTAVSELQSQHGISKLDVVIANAGISEHYALAKETSLDETVRHNQINFIAPLALFQATLPLLERSTKPKFVGISTAIASIGKMGDIPFPATAYGSSKAALNYFLRKAHFENEKLIVYPLNPGWVQTDMGNAGAAAMGKEAAPMTLEDSVRNILANIDGATKEATSGTFQSVDEEATYPW